MNKLKKTIVSIGVFIIGIISKVYANEFDIEVVPAYAVDPGPSRISIIICIIRKIVFPVVLFILGLIVILNKKMKKKDKVIIISFVIIIAILISIEMKDITT